MEQNTPGANITAFADALWWAVATITTVGYGDFYPVTQLGRFVAAGLMIGGIAVLGIVTAAVASWLVEHVAAETRRTRCDGTRTQGTRPAHHRMNSQR